MKKCKLIKKSFIKLAAPLLSALTLAGCKSEVIDINQKLAEAGYTSEYENSDKYIKVNYNPEYREIVTINSDIIVKPVNIYKALEEIKEQDNYQEAVKIIKYIPYIDEDQSQDLVFEQKCDNISLYLIALQKINENNPAMNADLIKYHKYYQNYLYDYRRNTEYVLVYEALVYQKMLDNNLDMVTAIDELNELLTNYAQNSEYEVGINDYPELVKALNDGETIKDIYLPLAYDLHRVTCNKEHDIINNTFTCDELINNKVKSY